MKRSAGLHRRAVGLAPMSAKARAERDDHDLVRRAVFDRDRGCLLAQHWGHRCMGPLTVHHTLKASQGGAYDLANLVALCAHGNDWVEDHPRDAWTLGLVLRRGDEPHEAAQRRWLHGLVPQ